LILAFLQNRRKPTFYEAINYTLPQIHPDNQFALTSRLASIFLFYL